MLTIRFLDNNRSDVSIIGILFVTLIVVVIEQSTGKVHKVKIAPLEDEDFRGLTKKRYVFDWKLERAREAYKLMIQGDADILGVVSIDRIPEEWRLHIRLLTVSLENKGSKKQYENIAGNLITYIAKLALQEYAELACVSLKPKGKIAQHYIDKYGMNVTGITQSIELREILALIKTFDHD